MCREVVYKPTCCGQSTSFNPALWEPCSSPNGPACVKGPPIIQPLELRQRSCPNCARALLPAPRNYSSEVNAWLMSEYKRDPNKEVFELPSHLLDVLPRAHAGRVDGDNRAARLSEFDAEDSQLNNADSGGTSSSSQQTGVVYTEDKQKYSGTVPETNITWPDDLVDEIETLNDPDMDPTRREALARGRPGRVVGTALSKKVIDWTDKTQKK